MKNAQQAVDDWIAEHGVRYFDELTNMAQLTEEIGEVARIIARRYGEQSEKESDKQKDQSSFDKKLELKTERDHDRHQNNQKLK